MSAEEAAEYAREQGLHFAETSAKTAAGVGAVFEGAASAVLAAAGAGGGAPAAA